MNQVSFQQMERFAFYERAKKAFAVVHTGYAYWVLTLCNHYNTREVLEFFVVICRMHQQVEYNIRCIM